MGFVSLFENVPETTESDATYPLIVGDVILYEVPSLPVCVLVVAAVPPDEYL